MSASPAAVNPLLAPWATPFEAPPFDAIKDGDFGPAFEEALAAHRVEIDRIANDADGPTFENTIVALENSGRTLSRVSSVFWNLAGANTNDALQAIERDISPKLAQHWNAITSNAALFARVDAVMQAADAAGLDAEQRRVLERTHLAFVRAGARLQGDNKKRMSDIIARLATLGTQFSQNVLADERSYVLPLTDDDIAGLPDFVVATARKTAEERGEKAKYVVTLSRSLIEPFLTFSPRRDLREQAFKAWTSRGENGGATDNRAIIAETLALRRERAQLLGYETFAAYKLDNSMAKTPANVRSLLDTVWPAAKAKAAIEREKLQAMARSEGANITIEPWDWRYYSEKVRKAEYDLDEASVKPYLPLDRIIEAAFYTANRLFGLQFKERTDLALYHPDVRAFEVADAKGQSVGLFLGDYFARSSKRSGAWMSSYRSQERLGGDIRPIIVNVCNFAKGADGEPALLSFDDARTLFHEFGHALHGLLSDVRYPSLSGTSVSRDFVELPSQLYEHWLTSRDVLEKFARHYKTGEAMPAAMIDKLRAAQTFNQGFATVEYLSSAILDIDYHSEVFAEANETPLEFEAARLTQIEMPREIVMRHRTPHFSHIFSGDGYSSGYYSYLWSEVLDADAFAAFEETGNVFDPDVAARLKQFVYGAGGLRKEDEAYIAFRGKLPSVDGLLKQRGLVA
ncbi:M3 family metallopeptidase [Leptospira interrogans]